MEEIYLDYSASTPLLPQVKQKLFSVLSIYANPSSLHQAGIQSAILIEEARNNISIVFHCLPEELYFTSGATMSNNQAIQGFIKANPSCVVITSSIEHDDIYLMLQSYPKNKQYYIPCDKAGRLSLDYLKQTLDGLSSNNKPILISIQWANNEMGIIQDMKAIIKLVKSYPNTFFHTDATQYVPYYSIDLSDLQIDILSMSAQKIGGLKGTGLLYVKEGVSLSPIIYGDQGLIGGTENVPGIACLGEAVKSIDYSEERIYSIKSKRDYLLGGLCNNGILVGSLENRLPNNINMIFDGIRGEELQALLSDFGVYVSTGSACSSHTDEPSRTLTAMGYSKEEANSSIRFSISDNTSYEDLNYVINLVNMNVENLRNK